MKYLSKIILFCFFYLTCVSASAEQKIVILDLSYILNNSKAGKGAQDFAEDLEKIVN